MAANLKEAIAEVAVEVEAAVAAIGAKDAELAAKDAKIAELEAAGSGGTPQGEATELAASASTSAANLKAALEPPETPVS